MNSSHILHKNTYCDLTVHHEGSTFWRHPIVSPVNGSLAGVISNAINKLYSLVSKQYTLKSFIQFSFQLNLEQEKGALEKLLNICAGSSLDRAKTVEYSCWVIVRTEQNFA